MKKVYEKPKTPYLSVVRCLRKNEGMQVVSLAGQSEDMGTIWHRGISSYGLHPYRSDWPYTDLRLYRRG